MIAAMSTMPLKNSFKSGDMTPYCVGIDLGTTNCAVAYFERDKPGRSVQVFRIPQIGRQGGEEALPLLPSFLYLNPENPHDVTVGLWAKLEGAETPTRLIQSAKSWLSNAASKRKEKILPLEAEKSSHRFSPVEASALYLSHIKEMWNRHIAKADESRHLEEQQIILTVPASFDEIARSLTIEAATLAGFKQVTLLEEPQAAFYNWIKENGMDCFVPGDSILVCDVGGGTTDFSLIDVVEGSLGTEMRRMAVGKHLLLGGDNMDITLSYMVEKKIKVELDTAQHLSLIQQLRAAKEILLDETTGEKKQSSTIFVKGRGSQVVGGSISVEISRSDVQEALLDGFFGLYSFDKAIELQKGSGIRQMGLAYESEPCITKHLAHFLLKNERKHSPTHVLFNGGAMKPKIFQDRIVDSLFLWFGGEKKAQVLQSTSLDLSVAKGAAFFGIAREGKGPYIGGGIPRSYYLEIQTPEGKKALNLVPRGEKEGSCILAKDIYKLIPNQPVVFQLYHSSTRLHDKQGELIAIDEEELAKLPPVQTICKYGKKESLDTIGVQIQIELTAIGTLELWLLSAQTPHRWKLEFQLNKEIQDERLNDETLDVAQLKNAQSIITDTFAIGAHSKLISVMGVLEKELEKPKALWSPSILRGLFDTLMQHADKRVLSSQYEERFWNLAGYFLRPGFGYPLDDFRMKGIWRIILADCKKTRSEEVLVQQWICFRRIAAGLSRGQQGQLFSELNSIKTKRKGYTYAEHLRALAALELVEVAAKVKLGDALVQKILSGAGETCDYWALGRLGARQLFHGTINSVVPRTTCEEWVKALIKAPLNDNQHRAFALTMLARKTGLREIDLSPSLRETLTPYLIDSQDLLALERELTLKEQERFFGDSLPLGLIVESL